MAAPTLRELREELAENLSTIDGVQVSAWLLANPTPPAIEVAVDEVNYDHSMGRGSDEWFFVVRAYVGAATDRAAQIKLDTLLAPSGSGSVKTALEATPTLDGKCEDLHVVSASGYRIFQRAGGPELLGCEWRVRVIALGE